MDLLLYFAIYMSNMVIKLIFLLKFMVQIITKYCMVPSSVNTHYITTDWRKYILNLF